MASWRGYDGACPPATVFQGLSPTLCNAVVDPAEDVAGFHVCLDFNERRVEGFVFFTLRQHDMDTALDI